jgi:hypothetical protein
MQTQHGGVQSSKICIDMQATASEFTVALIPEVCRGEEGECGAGVLPVHAVSNRLAGARNRYHQQREVASESRVFAFLLELLLQHDAVQSAQMRSRIAIHASCTTHPHHTVSSRPHTRTEVDEGRLN